MESDILRQHSLALSHWLPKNSFETHIGDLDAKKPFKSHIGDLDA